VRCAAGAVETALACGTAAAVALDYTFTARFTAEFALVATGALALVEGTCAEIIDAALCLTATGSVASLELAPTGGSADAAQPFVAASSITRHVDALAIEARATDLVGVAGAALEHVPGVVFWAATGGSQIFAGLRCTANAVYAALGLGTAGAIAACEIAVTGEGVVAGSRRAAVSTAAQCGTASINGGAAGCVKLFTGLRCATDIASRAYLTCVATSVTTADRAFAAAIAADFARLATRAVTFNVYALAGVRFTANLRAGLAFAALELIAAGIAGKATGGSQVFTGLRRTAGVCVIADLSIGAAAVVALGELTPALEVISAGAFTAGRAV